jgi:hypothetical protein
VNELLKNGLVLKYFDCAACTPEYHDTPWGCPFTALRVLRAMQEPIKKGDTFLWFDVYRQSFDQEIKKDTADFAGSGGLHPYALRLPSQFQPRPAATCQHPYASLVFGGKGILCGSCGEIVAPKSLVKPAVEKCEPGKCVQHSLAETWCLCECHKPAPESSDYISPPAKVVATGKITWDKPATEFPADVEEKITDCLNGAGFIRGGMFHQRLIEMIRSALARGKA